MFFGTVTQSGTETTKLLGQSHSSDLNPHPELLHKGMPIWRTPRRGFPSSLPALTPAGVPYLRVGKQGMIRRDGGGDYSTRDIDKELIAHLCV